MELPLRIKCHKRIDRNGVVEDLRSEFPSSQARINWLGDVVVREGKGLIVFITIRNGSIGVHARPPLLACLFSGMSSVDPVAEAARVGKHKAKLDAAQKYSDWLKRKYRIADAQ